MDLADVVREERPPRLRPWVSATHHVLRNGGLTQDDPELPELAVDARRTPQWVRVRHGADQHADIGCYGRPARAGARAHQLRFAPLRERDRDQVEVARDDRRGEELCRLLHHLVPEVPRRDVCEREKLHARLLRDERRFARGRVRRLPRARALVGQERRLVDENVGTRCRLHNRGCRRRVSRHDELPTHS